MGIMMVPQFRFESTPWLQQHFLFFIIKSKRNHTHPLLESCQEQLTAILISGTKPAGTLGWLPSLAWAQHMNSFNWWVWTGRSRGHHRHSNGPNKLKNDIPSELKGSSLNFTKLPQNLVRDWRLPRLIKFQKRIHSPSSTSVPSSRASTPDAIDNDDGCHDAIDSAVTSSSSASAANASRTCSASPMVQNEPTDLEALSIAD